MGNNKFDYILLEFIEIPYILICSETSLQSMTNCFSLNWISKVDIRADCFSIYTVFKVQYCKSKLIDYGCPIRFSFYKHESAYLKIASSNTFRLDAQVGFFRLFMKRIFGPYVL